MAINGHWRLGRAEAEATAGAMFALGIEWLMGDRCRRRIIPAAAKRNRVQRLIIPSKDMQSAVAGLINLFFSIRSLLKFCKNRCSWNFSAILLFPPNYPSIHPVHAIYTGRPRGQQTRRTTKREEGRAVIPKSHPLLYCIIIITCNKIKVIKFINLWPFFSHLPRRWKVKQDEGAGDEGQLADKGQRNNCPCKLPL